MTKRGMTNDGMKEAEFLPKDKRRDGNADSCGNDKVRERQTQIPFGNDKTAG
jgi:hypothetical protein